MFLRVCKMNTRSRRMAHNNLLKTVAQFRPQSTHLPPWFGVYKSGSVESLSLAVGVAYFRGDFRPVVAVVVMRNNARLSIGTRWGCKMKTARDWSACCWCARKWPARITSDCYSCSGSDLVGNKVLANLMLWRRKGERAQDLYLYANF
jgi:hypothetical protein